MRSFAVNITRCDMCPAKTECVHVRVDLGYLPNDCPKLTEKEIRADLFEALSLRDNDVRFLREYGSRSARIAIGFGDENWKKLRDRVREQQRIIEEKLALLDSFLAEIPPNIREKSEDWYSEELDKLESEAGSI